MYSLEQINSIDGEITTDLIGADVIDNLYKTFEFNIRGSARVAYGLVDDVAVSSFKKDLVSSFKDAICTFHNKKHHLNGRDLNSYLGRVIKIKALKLALEIKGKETMGIHICPSCKNDGGATELFNSSDGILSCPNCAQKLEDVKNSDTNIFVKEAKIKYYSAFAKHSRSGVKCPDCNRFVPVSIASENGDVCCPYVGCIGVMNVDSMPPMSHPIRRVNKNYYNSSIEKLSENKTSFYDIEKQFSPERIVVIKSEFSDKYKLAAKCIFDYKKVLNVNHNACTIQQMEMMCEAYVACLTEYKTEMVSYLLSNKGSGDYSMQSKIFQKYAEVIRDSLPLTIQRRKKDVLVYDLCDPNLALFESLTSYTANVSDRFIPNETEEQYIGSRGHKSYGKYYIGSLVDIICEDKSIKDNVLSYTFHNIEMKNHDYDGKEVLVKHYSILPHYEIGSLVYLRRVKTEVYDRLQKELAR